jgi:DNA-binding transcriptional LysR family regulator
MARFDELEFFVAVAQTGSFTAASKRLGVPKSTLTRGVGRLEKRLDVVLMRRTTRRVTLTEPGELFLLHCLQALEEVEQGELVVSAFRGVPRGHLRVSTPMVFARIFLTPLMPEFLTLYPDLRLHLLAHEADSMPSTTNFDVIIRSGPVQDSSMFIRHLGEVRMGIYASPEYVERSGSPTTPDQLHQHSCVTLAEFGDGAIWRITNGSEALQIRLDPHVSASNATLHQILAAGGVGIVCIPRALASPDVTAGRLLRILPGWEPEPVPVSALYPARLDLSPKVRAFLQYLAQHLWLE